MRCKVGVGRSGCKRVAGAAEWEQRGIPSAREAAYTGKSGRASKIWRCRVQVTQIHKSGRGILALQGNRCPLPTGLTDGLVGVFVMVMAKRGSCLCSGKAVGDSGCWYGAQMELCRNMLW